MISSSPESSGKIALINGFHRGSKSNEMGLKGRRSGRCRTWSSALWPSRTSYAVFPQRPVLGPLAGASCPLTAGFLRTPLPLPAVSCSSPGRLILSVLFPLPCPVCLDPSSEDSIIMVSGIVLVDTLDKGGGRFESCRLLVVEVSMLGAWMVFERLRLGVAIVPD